MSIAGDSPRDHSHDHAHDHGGGADLEALRRGSTAEAWDAIYSPSERRWSGQPNQALVDEVSGMAPGTALDVGCGEGADAVWLAQQGWRVSGLDVSGVALERARAAAESAGAEVQWLHSGLDDTELPEDGFDLVSAFYPALPRQPEGMNLIALLGAVAPGGTLLFVAHADVDPDEARERGFDPDAYLSIDDLEAALRRSSHWEVTTRERRSRRVADGAGAGHTHDEVLRAVHSAE
ncbi:bifunctional 2-polyprenyl-6-hydroxyphenol methylase/3-demethylubiquinol 3-O-methyltransferase UbiG [Kocuria palustris]|uniref:class I SAM-dependent methyltransferase n=1 Tax=Kocuria palustris TaxID=71999 RepID=UPI00119F0CE1|nr:class I SAM-dependent methyltransferase [Kocuria palustris]